MNVGKTPNAYTSRYVDCPIVKILNVLSLLRKFTEEYERKLLKVLSYQRIVLVLPQITV